MLEYLEHVLVPYVNQTRSAMELPSNFPAVAVFDVFAAHRCQSLPARASEQGNVIGLVSVYIYIYMSSKKNCN